MHRILPWIVFSLLVSAPAARCWADGGAVRARLQDGRFQISAFTSPNPLLAGTADISVMVQDAKTLEPLPHAAVEISIAPQGYPEAVVRLPATAELATNKLFRACLVELEPGSYEVQVTCHEGDSAGRASFPLEVGAPPAQLATLWPWFTWPVVPIVLFCLHRRRVQRPGRQSA